MAETPGFSFPSERPGQTVQIAIGRNDPCPCGGGLKVKKCHLGISPPPSVASADPRLWPLLAALTTNAITYLGDSITSFARSGFADADVGVQSQAIATCYYACVSYRVASAILALAALNQGEEAIGLQRELDEARMRLAYYQRFPGEAKKLIFSRHSNLLTFSERRSNAGLSSEPDAIDHQRLKLAAEREKALHPEIMSDGRKHRHWQEPNIKAMMIELHEAWSADADAKHVGILVDATLDADRRGSSRARADSQYFAGSEVPSQWIHNTFLLADRYIEWGTPPRLRPLSNSMRESPNAFLEVVTDSVLAVANGIHRQSGASDLSRLQRFEFGLTWFQSLLASDRPCATDK